MNDIGVAAGEDKCTVLLVLDIPAAFDAVDHTILCQRLESLFGVNGTALSWITSFLSDRSQYVAVSNERSETARCVSGVPQGSVLGLLLFSLYVVTVRNIIEGHGVSLQQYADDIQIYVAIRPQGGLMNDLSRLVNCTDDVPRWFLESGLLLNSTKTEAIVFGTATRLKAVDMSISIMAASSNIKFSDAVKLLGVNLDRCLTMDSHVASVVRSCNFHIRALCHIRPRLTLDAAKSVAVNIVGSRLDYCNSLLHGTSQRNFDRLQRIQNAIARAVTQTRGVVVQLTELRRELQRQRVEFIYWS